RRSIVLATYWLPKVTLRARSSPTAMASPSSTDSQNPIRATRDGSTIWGVVLPDRRRAGCPRRPCGRAQVLPRWLRHQISAGTLQIGNGGTTGSVAGNIVDTAALVFNRSNALTYGGVISGTGSVSKSGAGTLTLTGDSTYTGGTTISAGKLQIGNGG